MRALRTTASWRQVSSTPTGDLDTNNWRLFAQCTDSDPELFFPIGNSAVARRQTVNAKAICAQCPVRTRCLEWARATDQMYGVWGGLAESERVVGHR
jgi:WhiB family redox-sensing transcriptional regulator